MALLAGRRRLALLGVFLLAVVYTLALYWYEIERTLSTSASTLSLWTNSASQYGVNSVAAEGPSNILPHIHADTLWITGEICALHGWDARPSELTYDREVWDTIILDAPTPAELDMLEIRLQELKDVVNKIFVVESNRTINGTPKEFFFASARFEDRFASFLPKLVYRAVSAPSINSIRSPPPDVWRKHLYSEINSLMRTRSSNTRLPPLVLFADVDEVPAAYTLRLLRTCAFPAPIHLQLNRYLYSYEWPAQSKSWRAQVHLWDSGMTLESLGDGKARLKRRRTEYSRDLVSENVLAGAGWHCTYCYGSINDTVAQMRDDLGFEDPSITPERVQRAICEGENLVDSEPFNTVLTKSAVNIPWFIIEQSHKYRHMLPGACNRTLTPQVQVQISGKKENEAP